MIYIEIGFLVALESGLQCRGSEEIDLKNQFKKDIFIIEGTAAAAKREKAGKSKVTDKIKKKTKKRKRERAPGKTT